MDVHYYSLIPLVAAIAYIPLFAVLISNRPWQKWHRLFALYLAAAMLWSMSTFFLRSDFFIEHKLLLFRVTICSFVWLAVQFYYFVRFYFARSAGVGTWIGYATLAILITLAALGYAPQSVTFDAHEVIPDLGWWLFLFVVPSLFLIGSLVWFLLRRRRVSVDPQESNRITYLLIGIFVVVISTFGALTTLGGRIPFPQLGHLVNACILIYAVLRYRLLAVNFVMRRGLVYGFMSTMFLLVYSLWLFLINIVLGFGFSFGSYLVVGLLTIASAAAFWARARVYIYRKVDQIFYGESYNYRQELVEFLVRKAPVVSNLDEFGRELLVPLTKAVGCWQAHLLLPDADNGDFIAQFAEPQEEGNPPLRLRQDSPVVGWLKRENRYLSKETLDILPEFRALWGEEKDGFRAADLALLFPLVSRGNLISILALGKKQSGNYTLEDVNLVETITTQVATSLEKEYLQEQLRKREQELALINRLDTVITSSLNIREVYGAFIAELKEVIDVDWATIALIEGGELYFEVLSTEVGSAWQAGEKIPLEGTGTEWVAKRKKALFEPDLARTSKFWTGEAQLKQGIRSIVYLPLIVKGDAIGSLVVASRQPNAYTSSQVHLLESLASQIAMPVENSRLYAKAEQRARVDELTGLFNRRHFDERLREEIDRHSRYGGMMSLIFLDLDLFKDYNDKYGHLAGDKVLARVGRLVEKSIRNIDIAFRYGGDEFAVLLPKSVADDAFVVAERVRVKIAAEMRKKRLRITTSLGLASWPSDGVTPDELVTAADRALYYTKKTGGNRTCVASKMLPSLTETVAMSKATEKETSSVIYALAATIEARDPFTYGHSKKVSSYAVALAEAIGLPSEKVTVVSTAALLHDIGKIGIPDELLTKVGKLEAETWELVQSHAKLSATIVGHVVSLVSCLPAILHHHERWDGTGYPSRLKGEAIPIEARILAIADAFDAMTSPRPYREPLSYKKVLDELRRCAGTQFDPELVEAFLPIALSTAPEDIEAEEPPGISKAAS
jgi:diguanylate cyclase (GGDEF)-like protein/putative nucleotidyltransferase with HDIG domain